MAHQVKIGTAAGLVVLAFFGMAVAADKFEDEFGWEKIAIGLSSRRPRAATNSSAPKS